MPRPRNIGLITPFQELMERALEIRGKFPRRNFGFPIKMRIQVSGFYNGERVHCNWYNWDRTKPDIGRILREAGESFLYHEDFHYTLYATAADVPHSESTSCDITDLMRQLNLEKY